MKRLLVTVLFALLITVLFVLPASAATNITNVSVQVVAPVAGAEPDYSPWLDDVTYYLDNYCSNIYLYDVAWYDVTASRYLSVNPKETFQAGHQYQVYMFLTPANGYAFTESSKGTINGNTATAAVYSGQLRITYTFPKIKTPISYADIYLWSPRAGEEPDYAPRVYADDDFGDAHCYSAAYSNTNFKNDMAWYDVTDSAYLPVATAKFKAGHQYRVYVYLTAEDGYYFADDFTGFIYDDTPAHIATRSDTCIGLYYTYPVTPKWKIDYVSISITPPAAGAKPDYNPVLTSGATYCYFGSTVEDAYNHNDVYWEEMPDSPMYVASSTFRPGGQYKVWVTLTAKEDGEFTGETYAFVNGEKTTCHETSGALYVDYTFPKLSDKPEITKQPSSVTVAAGQTATFMVKATATGLTLTYQWYYKKPGDSSWSQVKVNGTSATYSLTTEARHSGNKYCCKVTGGGESVYSSSATLTVVEKPAVTTQPANKTVVEGKTATFTVAASGGGLSYQWYYRKPGETAWNKVTTNGTGATYSLKTEARHNGYTYHCEVKNAAGSVTSSNAKLTVTPGITTQPGNQTVAAGKTATFKVVATGTGLTYQWYYQKSGETAWSQVKVNGTSATYSLAAEARHSGNKYRCLVTNSGGGSVYSSAATLTVVEKPAITTQPDAKTVVEGKTATFKVVASGTGLSYQWYYQKPGESTWNKVSANGTSATYSLTTTEARHNGYTYHCVVKNTAGSVTSSNARLTVTPGITTQPGNQSVAEGKTATFKVAATGTGLSYQWYYQKSGESTWNKVWENGTGATYSLATEARHSGNKYRCLVTNSGGGSVYSNTVTLTVTAKPTITTQPSNKTVTAGSKATFKVVASGTGLSYQWYYQKPGESTWNKVSTNGTSATYSLTTEARHNGYQYKCTVSNTAGSVTSKVVKLTVK